jgi:DNA-binding GntR family transcriptional regulator
MQNTVNEQEKRIGPADMPRVERQRLHDAVVEHLQKLIIEGVLAPGIKLNEREVCERLGISRTPLREAMKVLASEGLIEIVPNRGAFVSKMNDTEIWEAFEVMSGLEALSGELAAERISPAEIADIQQLHDEMLVCRKKNDLPGYYSRNQTIHNKINEAARNSVLRQIYQSINRRLLALRFKSNFKEAKWDRAIQDHEEMIAALEARDGKRLATILRQHLLEKRDAVMAVLREAAEQPDTQKTAAR